MGNTIKFLRIAISAFMLIICVQAPKSVFGWTVDYTFATSAKCEEYNNQRKECNSHFGCYHNDSSATAFNSTCKVCPAGKTCPDDYKNDVAPENCPAGHVCPVGTFYGKEPTCDDGYYCPAGSSQQTICPAGNYCDDKVAYYPCAAGKYQDQKGQTSCKSCTAGTYQDQTGQISCKTCSKGYKCNGTMQTTQTACTAGTYQDQEGQYTCKTCPVNKVCPSAGTITPLNCPTKYPKSDGGAANQSQCYYQASAGKRYSTSAGGEVDCNSGLSSAGYCPGGGTKIYYQSTVSDNTGRQSCPVDLMHQRTVSAPVAASSISDCYVSCSSGTITGGTITPNLTQMHAISLNSTWQYGICSYKVSCNTGYRDTSSYPAGSQYTMNPVCTELEYEIYLYPNPPADATHDITPPTKTYIKLGNYKYTQTATLTNPFSLEGWTFSHWTYNDNGDGDGARYNNNATVSQLTTTRVEAEFFAQWAPKESTITWDLNGGEPSDWDKCEQALQKDSSFTITKTPGKFSWQPATYSVTITAKYDKYLRNIPGDCKLYNAGYTFNGIGIPAGIVGVSPVYYYDENYAGIKQWNLMEDTTLTAFWEPNVIPVTLNPGNYTSFVQEVSPNKIELKYGTGWYTEGASSSGLPPRTNITKIPIVGGKLFNGFYYNDTRMIDNTGNFITSSESSEPSMTATLFTSGEYTFNADYTDCACSGSTGVSSTTATETTTENRCKCKVNCTDGYSQGGAYNPTVEFYYTGTAGNASVEVTCLPRKYKVTYSCGEGSGTPPTIPSTAVYDSNFTPASTDSCTKTGYRSATWSTTDNAGNSVSRTAEVPFKWQYTGNKTFTANWTPVQRKVTFNANGGSGEMEDQTFTYDDAQNLRTNTFTRTGYTFTGWNTADDGTGTAYTNEQSISKLLEDIILYAQWDANKYTVQFEANCTSTTPEGKMDLQYREYDDKVSLTANGFKCGKKAFMNWNTKADGTGDSFDNESIKDITTDTGIVVILYAQWIQCQAGCYCSGQITEEDIIENNEICKNPCPTNFTSDAGASAITDCYLIPGTKFTDRYETTFTVPNDAKYYWHQRNTPPTQTSE